MNRWFLALLILLAACSRAPQGGVTQAALKPEVDIQILTVSDWHAQLDPLVVGTAQVGGAAALSAYFKADRLANPNTLTLTAGDAYGASPPVSSFFNEVPAVQAMRLMGFNADTFGNHNFDKGTAFLQQLINIANAPAGGSQPGTPFQYVSANLLNRDANLSGVKDYQIFEVAGIKVAVIGITNPEAPTLVFPNSFGSIQFANTAAAANKARSNAAKEGAQVFIAITHMGVTNFDSAGAPVGPVIDFANSVGNFDLIVGDHTDVEYSGIINNALVVENRSKGLTYAKINLKVETKKGKVTARSSQFVTPLVSAVTPDPVIASLLNSYRTQLAPILSVVIGSSNRFVPRADACGTGNGRTCESLVGNITTDAMRTRYSTDFAITNSGGLRAG